jgi:hypothetical protein
VGEAVKLAACTNLHEGGEGEGVAAILDTEDAEQKAIKNE